jgi:hypothetical protein
LGHLHRLRILTPGAGWIVSHEQAYSCGSDLDGRDEEDYLSSADFQQFVIKTVASEIVH